MGRLAPWCCRDVFLPCGRTGLFIKHMQLKAPDCSIIELYVHCTHVLVAGKTVKQFPRVIIYYIFHFSYKFVAVLRYVRALWYKFADKLVGILVTPALTTAIRVTKIKRSTLPYLLT